MRHALLTTIAALIAAAPAAASAAAPTQAADGNWDAWIGCWQAIDEDGALEVAGGSNSLESPGTNELVCVLPGDNPQTARFATVEDGRIVSEMVVTADGQQHAVDEGGCKGTESAVFSSDGRRVYTRADLDCRSFARVSTGVFALVSDVEWIDAQGVTVSGQATGRTVRYRAVPQDEVPAAIAATLPSGQRLALEAVRLDAAAPLDIDDVIEAARVIGAPALEALLGARQQGFGLNARQLAQLADAGVPSSTVDVMVALSYPHRFAVRETTASDRYADGMRDGRDAALEQYCEAMARDVRRGMRPRYGFSTRNDCYRYGSSMGSFGFNDLYGYNYYGYGNSQYWGNGPVMIIPRDDQDPRETGGTVSRDGYTRGNAPARGTARPRSGSERSASRPSTSASRPSTSASRPATSSAGSRSEPTRSDPTPPRRAKPRPGGGGGGGDAAGGAR